MTEESFTPASTDNPTILYGMMRIDRGLKTIIAPYKFSDCTKVGCSRVRCNFRHDSEPLQNLAMIIGRINESGNPCVLDLDDERVRTRLMQSLEDVYRYQQSLKTSTIIRPICKFGSKCNYGSKCRFSHS